jgi:hypothetical protein
MPLRPQPIALDARVDTKTAAVVDRAVEMRARRSTRFVATYLHYAEAPEHVIERVLAGAQARRQPR